MSQRTPQAPAQDQSRVDLNWTLSGADGFHFRGAFFCQAVCVNCTDDAGRPVEFERLPFTDGSSYAVSGNNLVATIWAHWDMLPFDDPERAAFVMDQLLLTRTRFTRVRIVAERSGGFEIVSVSSEEDSAGPPPPTPDL